MPPSSPPTPTEAPKPGGPREGVRPRPTRLSMGAWRRFLAVALPYWRGDERHTAWVFLAGLIVLMLAETQLAVLLNEQSGEVASALAAREGERFWAAVRQTLALLALAVPVFAAYYYARDAYSNRWRRWLTGRFVDGYLADRRYYALQRDHLIDNPDQRISEDINTFTGRALHFLLLMLGSFMQLLAFSAVLWAISPTLVGVLAVYALVGTVLAIGVFGAPLIRLNFWQIRREADLRFGLMRVRENAEPIAFYRGERQERGRIGLRFDAVFSNYEQLIRAQFFLNLFQRGYGQLALLLPSVLLAEAVLSGRMEVGKAVQAGGAFAMVLGALAVIVDNFESLSRFVAGIDRLHALASRVLNPSGQGEEAGAIQRSEGPELRLEGLSVALPGGQRWLVRDVHLHLRPGEALLVTGPSGCGKSSLLRALAGLWTEGTGRVELPPAQDVMFLPQQSYIQEGSLRSQLAYPSPQSPVDDAQLREVLRAVQLAPLLEAHALDGGLDACADWAKLLSGGEQQRLAFARLLVHRPRLAVLDEATSALDAANEARLYQMLRDAGTTLVSVAHRAAVLRFHDWVLHLKPGGGWALERASEAQWDA